MLLELDMLLESGNVIAFSKQTYTTPFRQKLLVAYDSLAKWVILHDLGTQLYIYFVALAIKIIPLIISEISTVAAV